MSIKFYREWAMPSSDTFSIPIIGGFVQKYLIGSKVSIDPFSRNKRWATYTNDLNTNTKAEYHMEALDFLDILNKKEIKSDLVIFDPPYSPRQVSECYNQVGKKTSSLDTSAASWANWKKAINPLVSDGGIVLSFGWNSCGMGIKMGYEIEEILLVCHGGQHNDTICIAEKKISDNKLF